jgi:hypothetical protein
MLYHRHLLPPRLHLQSHNLGGMGGSWHRVKTTGIGAEETMASKVHLAVGYHALPIVEYILHSGRFYGPGLAHTISLVKATCSILLTSYQRAFSRSPRHPTHYRLLNRSPAILQEMPCV